MNLFEQWAETVERIRAHRADGHHLAPVESSFGGYGAGVHLTISDPGLADQPICDSFDDKTTRPSDYPADCTACLALAREALRAHEGGQVAPALNTDREVWKLKAFNNHKGSWVTKHVGGEEALSRMLGEMLRWKAEGQQVRLEWSELN